MAGHLRRIIFFALLLLIWEAVFKAAFWPEFLFPSPGMVMHALVRGFTDHSFLVAIAISMKRLTVGYIISALLGIPLGLLVGRVKTAQETVGATMLGLQNLPSICWLPLALIWFGLNEKAIVFVVVIGSLLAIGLATEAGVRNTSPLLLRAARTMGAGGVRLYWNVIIPAAFPAIATGLKLGWTFAWRSLMSAELLFVSLGLGHLLMMGRELNDMSQVIAVMLLITAIGVFFDKLLFGQLETGVRERWGLLASTG